MKKIWSWLKNHMPSKRRLIQLYAALLYNANVKGFISGNIYTGNSKMVCVPGMNCYSCPGAVGACPLGSLQNALSSANKKAPYYVIGIILLYGLIFGRTICGWFCPFGLIQDLLYKVKSWKLKKNKVTFVLSYLKYFLLVVFAIIIPTIYGFKGIAVPAFCKYICPSGTLEGAIGLISNPNNEILLGMLNILFSWKLCLLVCFIVCAIFIYRPFCRFICPIGAIYSLFAKFNILGVQVNKSKCTNCGLCVSTCKVDIRHVGDKECIHCGDCIPVCPTNAITFKGSRVFINPNAQMVTSIQPTKIVAPANEVSLIASPTAGINNKPVDNLLQEEVALPKDDKKYQKRRKIFNISVTAFCIASLTGALVYFNFIKKEDSAEFGTEIGDICPSMRLDAINGLESYSVEDSEGKVTILNFWGTWCGPCVQELPYFERVQETYKDEVVVTAIHSGYLRESAQEYVTEHWPDYIINFALDTEDGDYYDVLGFNGAYPITYILDQEGIIQYKYVGSIPHDDLEDIYNVLKTDVDSLLK